MFFTSLIVHKCGDIKTIESCIIAIVITSAIAVILLFAGSIIGCMGVCCAKPQVSHATPLWMSRNTPMNVSVSTVYTLYGLSADHFMTSGNFGPNRVSLGARLILTFLTIEIKDFEQCSNFFRLIIILIQIVLSSFTQTNVVVVQQPGMVMTQQQGLEPPPKY